jgi:hypothetical protein
MVIVQLQKVVICQPHTRAHFERVSFCIYNMPLGQRTPLGIDERVSVFKRRGGRAQVSYKLTRSDNGIGSAGKQPIFNGDGEDWIAMKRFSPNCVVAR